MPFWLFLIYTALSDLNVVLLIFRMLQAIGNLSVYEYTQIASDGILFINSLLSSILTADVRQSTVHRKRSLVDLSKMHKAKETSPSFKVTGTRSILTLGRQEQENCQFWGHLGYISISCVKLYVDIRGIKAMK